jgi:hypothetical protein
LIIENLRLATPISIRVYSHNLVEMFFSFQKWQGYRMANLQQLKHLRPSGFLRGRVLFSIAAISFGGELVRAGL